MFGAVKCVDYEVVGFYIYANVIFIHHIVYFQARIMLKRSVVFQYIENSFP